MDRIPSSLAPLIARKIAAPQPTFRRMCDVARDAAALEVAGNATLSAVAECLWGHVEPGCSSGARVSVQRMRELRKEARQCVSASSARRRYLLSSTDLHDLPFRLAMGPRGVFAKMFRISDVMRAAELKFKTQRAVDARRANARAAAAARAERSRVALATRAAEARTTAGGAMEFSSACRAASRRYVASGAPDALERLRAVADRYEALLGALAARGLTLREDSRVCREFVDNAAWGIEEVVERMAEMDFFHNHTRYAALMDGQIRLGWTRTDSRRDWVQLATRAAQREALDQWVATFPSRDAALATGHVPPRLAVMVCLDAMRDEFQDRFARFSVDVACMHKLPFPLQVSQCRDVMRRVQLDLPVGEVSTRLPDCRQAAREAFAREEPRLVREAEEMNQKVRAISEWVGENGCAAMQLLWTWPDVLNVTRKDAIAWAEARRAEAKKDGGRYICPACPFRDYRLTVLRVHAATSHDLVIVNADP